MQNDRYLILTAQLYDAKDMAATAKTKADKAGQRMAQDRIRIIQQGELNRADTASSNAASAHSKQNLSSLHRNEAAGGPPSVQSGDQSVRCSSEGEKSAAREGGQRGSRLQALRANGERPSRTERFK